MRFLVFPVSVNLIALYLLTLVTNAEEHNRSFPDLQ